MKNDVTSEVFSSGLRFKTAVLLHRPHISNKYTLDSIIMKLLTSFFWYHNISSGTPHAQVVNI